MISDQSGIESAQNILDEVGSGEQMDSEFSAESIPEY